MRAFKGLGTSPVPISSGRGSKVYDYDGNEYIDYVLSYGANILGHARPEILDAIKEGVDEGLGFGATHADEVRLAKKLQKAIPYLERVRFVNSGTEAVMGAVRLARGVTGRRKIVKFERAYHGHADHLLAKAGSGVAAPGLPGSDGVPRDITRQTIIARYGSESDITAIFKRHGIDIAAVIVEPVGGNDGVIPPDKRFLKFLRRITKANGALLIFDEVITGFRFHYGSAAEYLGIKPDIVCLGKIIGGGLPIGAYGGNKNIMRHLAPSGNVYQASTFGGNPIVMKAGSAALDALSSLKKSYKRLEEFAGHLAGRLKESARAHGVAAEIRSFGGMFSIKFKRKGHFAIFFRTLLERGVYIAPSEHESNFLSFAHTRGDVDRTIKAAEEAFARVEKEADVWKR